MKRLVAATIPVMGLAWGAYAADFAPVPAGDWPAAAAPVPDVAWTGFYLGAHGGYLWRDADVDLSDVRGAILEFDVEVGTLASGAELGSESITGGLQAGYNVQLGRFLTGIEADFSFMDGDDSTTYSALDQLAFPGAMTHSTFKSELDWLATLRARAGVTFNRALLYATGGLALGDASYSLAVSIPETGNPDFPSYNPEPWTASETAMGWALGAGVEVAVTHRLSVKAEYLHYDLEDETIRAMDPPVFGDEYLDYEFENDGDIVRAGLNFRF